MPLRSSLRRLARASGAVPAVVLAALAVAPEAAAGPSAAVRGAGATSSPQGRTVVVRARAAAAGRSAERLRAGRRVVLRFDVPVRSRSVTRVELRLRVLRARRARVVVLRAGRARPVAEASGARRGRWLSLDVTRAVRAARGRARLVVAVRGGSLAFVSPRARDRRLRPRLRVALAPRAPQRAFRLPVPAPPPPAPPPGPPPAPPPAVPELAPEPEPAPEPGPAPAAPPAATAEPSPATRRLAALLEDVAGAEGHRHGARDDGGLPLDGLKALQTGPGAYVGVYHALVGDAFEAYVATSDDLLTWRRRARLDVHAHQPTVAALPGGGYVVAYEVDGADGNRLRVRRYPDLAALLAGAHDREATPPRTLSPAAEGTPSVLAATAGGERLELGFHRFRDADVDRQAHGVLERWTTWTAQALPHVDSVFEGLGTRGNLGDRDHLTLGDGARLDLIEAQAVRGDWASWRTWLHEPSTGAVLALAPRTAGGSVAFANPTATRVELPDGRPGLVWTAFLPWEGAAPGEAGSLVVVHELPEGAL